MGAPTIGEILEGLRELHADLYQRGEGDTSYGYCFVSDPRKFSPDVDCCTEEEIQRWKDDCARAERGEKRETETRCQVSRDGDMTVLVTPSGYGLGINVIDGDPDAADVAERLSRQISGLEAWLEERQEELSLDMAGE